MTNIFSNLQNIFLDLATILGFVNFFGIYKFNNFIKICNSFSDLINSSTMIISKKHYDLNFSDFKNIFSDFVNILGLSLIGFRSI